MADTNQNGRAEFFDDDPFAELTRIMGHDPRAAGAAPAAAADDLGLDLERELMSGLDLDEPSDGEEEPETQWVAAEEQPDGEVSQPVEGSTGDEVFDDALERELFAQFDDSVAEEEPVSEAPAQAETVAEEAEEAGIDMADADFELAEEDISVEAASAAEAETQHAVWHDEPGAVPDVLDAGDAETLAVEPEAFEEELSIEAASDEAAEEQAVAWHDGPAVAVEEPLETEEPEAEALDIDLDAFEEELSVEAASAGEAGEQAAAWHDEPVVAIEDSLGTEEPEAAEGDIVDEALSVEEASVDAAFETDHAEDDPVAFEPVPVDELVEEASGEAAAPSLEDELKALLAANDSSAPVEYAPEAAAEPEAEEWHPAVNTFGRANFSALDSGEAEASVEAETSVEAEASLDEPVELLGEDDGSDIFGDDFDLELHEDEQEIEEPSIAPTIIATAAAAGAGIASWQTARAAPPADAPEIETVDVVESAQSVADDLDIPDIDYETPAPRAIDDLDGDFAHTFGEPAPVAEPASAAAEAQAAPAEEPEADAYALDDGQWQEADPLADGNFDYETDLEQAIAMAPYEGAATESASRRRGFLVAAVVAGVAAIGAVGVFGMSFLGGGSDAPVLVQADADPMKVRPENPGGATVPNQDNEVYQRVTDGASDTAPGQERLISTAEEPVDVASRVEPPALAPGISDEDGAEGMIAEPVADDDILAILDEAKSEDRIEATETDPAATTVAEEVAVVTPRRVRTMVVRPDGTMVPRDEPEQVAGVERGIVVPDEPALAVPELVPAGETLPEPALPDSAVALEAEEEDDGPVVETPQTVAVVPTRRAEPQAAAPAAQPAVQQQPAQAPAATPVSAPAAAAPAAEAASGWSMQIASQPTAEGAQATYQDLARRYGGVLEGRGVNIVRANIEGMGTYYRVRIPASSREEAIQLCTRYKSAGGSCFVSR